jgi:hypothetical protein
VAQRLSIARLGGVQQVLGPATKRIEVRSGGKIGHDVSYRPEVRVQAEEIAKHKRGTATREVDSVLPANPDAPFQRAGDSTEDRRPEGAGAWQLLAVINGWPPVPTTVPAWEWAIAGLRAT